MPHVSKCVVEKTTLDELRDSLIEVICTSTGSLNRKRLLSELLTGTEKIMLGKRLAVIFLLTKGVSEYEIWKKLKVSPSTVARLQSGMETKYRSLVRFVKEKENEKGIVAFLDKLMYGFFPAKTSNHWQWLDDL